jgi:hypothetical protein
MMLPGGEIWPGMIGPEGMQPPGPQPPTGILKSA